MNRWEVVAIDGYGKQRGAPTFVLAATEEKAKAAGKAALQLLGMKRVAAVRARPYQPALDCSIRAYVQLMDPRT